MNKPGLELELSMYASELRVSNANEATTRLKLIDAVIFELLGWHKDDVQVEERVAEDGVTGFIDYLVQAGPHSFVVEAKRIGKAFSPLPKARKASLADSWAKERPSADALKQARDYGRARSVGFCVVTDGVSWVTFPVNRRDQVPSEQSLALIFDKIRFTDSEEVREFKSALSRSSVIAGSLENELLGSSRDQIESRRLNKLYDKSFSKVNRKSIFSTIEREIVTAFNESLLAENRELLEKCYVQTPERTRFDERIRMYLHPREQVLRTRPIRPVGRRKDHQAVQSLLTENRLSARPIALLTIGLVGAGKTTFLDYVSKVSSGTQFVPSNRKPRGCWIYVDFRDFSIADEPKSILVDAVFEYVTRHPFLNGFKTSIEPAYANEIQSLKSGPLSLLASDDNEFNRTVSALIIKDYEEKQPYVRRILSSPHISFPIFLVVDNVDQVDSVEAQSKIFLEATAMARSMNCNLILAMRDATYVRNRSNAVFDAFDFDAVYIDPPDIKSVLSKRFAVAAQLLKGQRIDFTGETGTNVTVENAETVVNMLSESVLGTEVGRIIEIAATGDTRLALKMTRQFLQYGYSSTGKAIGIYQRTGRYRLPPHEALRAIMLGNQAVYRDNLSVIGNPFDAYLGRSSVQFLRLFVMSALVMYSSESDFDGIGVREMFDLLERIGVARADSSKALDDLISRRYVFTKSEQNLSEDSIVLPSRFCGYVIRDLIGRMMFLETAMFDTFISDTEIWDAIYSNMKLIYRERNFLTKFRTRREVVRSFFKYCEAGVDKLTDQARLRNLPPQWCSNPLSRIKPQFGADLQRASSSAKRTNSMAGQTDALPLFSKTPTAD